MSRFHLIPGKTYNLRTHLNDDALPLAIADVKGILLCRVEDGFDQKFVFVIGANTFAAAVLERAMLNTPAGPRPADNSQPLMIVRDSFTVGAVNKSTGNPYSLQDIANQLKVSVTVLIGPKKDDPIDTKSLAMNDPAAKLYLGGRESDRTRAIGMLRSAMNKRQGDIVAKINDDGTYILLGNGGNIDIVNPDGTFIACASLDCALAVIVRSWF